MRSLHGAISGLLIALFLAGNMGEAAGLHECPHHHAAASEAGHAASHTDDGAKGACTCIGTCHGEAGIGLPAGTTAAALVPAGVALGAGPLTASRNVLSIPYLLPWATGPPRA